VTTTNMQITIYSCTSADVAAIVQVLDQYGAKLDWGYSGDNAPDRITLGETYCTNYADGCASEEIAADLFAVAGDTIVFDTHTDPADEWLGTGVMYAPGLGKYEYQSTADGEPQFNAAQIREAAAKGPEGIAALLGEPWAQAIHAASMELGAGTGTSTLQSIPCPTCKAETPCIVDCPLGDPACKARECDEHATCRRPRRKRTK
jgi:hypothetical protein